VARVTVDGTREVRAAAVALGAVDRTVKAQTTRALTAALSSVWSEPAVLARARTPMDRAALAGVRAKATATSVRLTAGTTPTIAKGTNIQQAIEFGDPSKTFETYTRKSRRGGTHQVRRRTQQQLPAPIRRGRVIHPAVAEAIPRLLSLFTQTVIRSVHEAFEGRTS
jgi:hypothetical protein